MDTTLTPQIDPDLLVDGHAPPDHTGLPCSDGTFVKNFQEHPQSLLLTDSITPLLEKLRPEGDFCIGQDSGIYWRFVPDAPLRGAEAPDWFVVLGVPATLEGRPRRSYVLWDESVAPTLALEFVSGSGMEERDRTPKLGKFWVYEQAIRVPFYGIYEEKSGSLEMHHLIDGKYRRLEANEHGRYAIEPLGVELGLWSGTYAGVRTRWLRFWDDAGQMLPTGHERAEQLQKKVERLAELLRAAGLPTE